MLVGVLPLGSYEQHGPHLPPETDSVFASHLAECLMSRFANLRVSDCMTRGMSDEHAWHDETISVDFMSFLDAVSEHCGDLLDGQQAERLILLNCHGGNRGALEVFARHLRTKTGVWSVIVNPLAFIAHGRVAPEIHAGFVETSLMLAMRPELVLMGEVRDSMYDNMGWSRSRAITKTGGLYIPWNSNDDGIGIDGVIGDPRGSSRGYGIHFLEQIMGALSDVIQLIERL